MATIRKIPAGSVVPNIQRTEVVESEVKQVGGELERQDELLSVLSGLVTTLDSAFNIVLRESDMGIIAECVPPPYVQLAQKLYRNNDFIETISARIRDILSRVEL